jgi:MFS transporter, SP family, general alpha glucoside:H+ symporter
MSYLNEKTAAAHVEATLGATALDDAKNASDNEHKATFWTAVKTHKKAVFWSAVISMSIVMEGYDTILLGNFWACEFPFYWLGYWAGKVSEEGNECADGYIDPEFQKKYGEYHGDEIGYLVSGPWQAGLGNASVCGTIIGAFINGWATSRYGYRLVMIVALFFMNAFIFITFFAKNIETLLVGQIFCGLTWGVFATTGPGE